MPHVDFTYLSTITMSPNALVPNPAAFRGTAEACPRRFLSPKQLGTETPFTEAWNNEVGKGSHAHDSPRES